MNILIAGGTGFIGTQIVKSMLQKGHDVYVLTRTNRESESNSHLHYITWLNENETDFSLLPSMYAVLNFAGDPINKGRWTSKKKKRILESRQTTTSMILDVMKQLPQKPNVYINASAIGVYGYSDQDKFTEDSPTLGNSFPAQVCSKWERLALEAETIGIRTIIARIGIVLGKTGGALPRMIFPYHLFVGGKVASGKQWISWIHIDDLVELIDFMIEHDEISGPVNLTAPKPVQMNELGRAIGTALHRPHWIPVPSFALKLIFGEMSEFLIEGQYVLPKKALDHHFEFNYKHVDKALQEIVKKNKES